MVFEGKDNSLVIATTIVLLIFGGSINQTVLAQTKDKEAVTVDWGQILTLVGLSGVISGGGVAIFKYLSDRSQSRNERQRKAIEDRVSLYSTLIFHLDRMIENPEFKSGTENGDKIKATIDDIDELLKAKFYLIDAKSVSRWLHFRNHWEDLLGWIFSSNPQQKESAQKIVDKVIELRNGLVNIYNNEYCKLYEQRMNTSIEKIDPEQRASIRLSSSC